MERKYYAVIKFDDGTYFCNSAQCVSPTLYSSNTVAKVIINNKCKRKGNTLRWSTAKVIKVRIEEIEE